MKVFKNSANIRITIDPFLPVVIILMAWVLSARYFPQLTYSPAPWVYWTMGGISSLFLTLSIFVHECGHAAAARWLKLPLERIHLYLFGGTAELRQRPVRPSEEMLIALSGPAASLLFALLAWLISLLVAPLHYQAYLVVQFVFYMNVLLAAFNLLPIYPLDGGRAMRALLWQYKKRYYRASVSTYYVSLAFIGVLVVVAAVLWFAKGFSSAFWAVLLAFYLWYTAYTGRDELIHEPGFDDLVYRVREGQSLAALIRQINRLDEDSLPSAVIPVGSDGAQLEYVVYGRDLASLPAEEENLEHLYRPLERGYYVDVNDESTYLAGETLQARLLPVLRDGELLGLSDANEIRFWLLQKKVRPQQPEGAIL